MLFVKQQRPNIHIYEYLPHTADAWTEHSAATIIVEEFLQNLLDLREVVLGLCDSVADHGQALLLVRFVPVAIFALLCTKILNLLAMVLDFRQTKSRAGSFQKMAELGQSWEILLLTVLWLGISSTTRVLLGYSQRCFHLFEFLFGLREEIVDDWFAEVSLLLILVHLKDLVPVSLVVLYANTD